MIKDFFWVFFVSMIPVIELRGAIPIGCGLGLPALEVFIAAVLGNLLPVPFIILFIRKIFILIRRCWPWLNSMVTRLENKAMSKADFIHKYELLGLTLFVAIPLPGTGAWTGALIAALMDIRIKRSFPAILIGVIIAGLIITLLSYGIKLGVQTMG
jgi:uncharacterized membrane protein